MKKRSSNLIAVAAAAVLLIGAGSFLFRAYAASDMAWEEFRHDVAQKCEKAAADQFDTAHAIVDPFGSQSYGMALVHGKAKGADAQISAICVYDKKTKTVEIGGELPES